MKEKTKKSQKKTPKEKLEIVKKQIRGVSVTELSRHYGVSREQIYEWVRRLEDRATEVFEDARTTRARGRMIQRADSLKHRVDDLEERLADAENRAAFVGFDRDVEDDAPDE